MAEMDGFRLARIAEMTERQIKYLIGDATNPVRQNPNTIICITHCCNDLGAWGSGFVLALSAKWKDPEQQYRAWFMSKPKPSLGEVQHVIVEPNILVANIIGQKGVIGPKNVKPVRYYAIKRGLKSLVETLPERTEFHMPRMGCGLAGGEWEEIESILVDVVLPTRDVVVYDLPSK